MRLAILTNILAPYRVPLFEELARHCDLLVLLLADRHANRDWAPGAVGFATRTLPGLRLRSRGVDPVHINVGTWGALRHFKPDVVLGGGFTPAHLSALAYCRVKGRPYISWGELHLRHESETLALRRLIRHVAVRASAGWIASSSQTRDAFVRYGATHSRVKVSLMPVRNALFRKLARGARESGAVTQWRERFGTPLICGVGRLAADKGWRQLLEALPEVRRTVPVKLVVAGDGPDRALLNTRASELGLDHVHFAGNMDPESLATLYAAADVFVFPTLNDPFGAVLAEAIACGTLAVSSRHAAATHDLVVHGHSGFVVDPLDPADLAGALIHAVALPEHQRREMAARAAQQLAPDDVVAGAQDLLNYSRDLAFPGDLRRAGRAVPGR